MPDVKATTSSAPALASRVPARRPSAKRLVDPRAEAFGAALRNDLLPGDDEVSIDRR